ncbi:unnamed protein product [Menidia menidia]|uniref:(Atlantic silverside) hypothetical protein n=1 Tax=Menidia menidia TaxID=238744 RepID=A0A8S4B4H0_9TELE|nr:unnamed protein product [Menidia menidia]
MNRAQSKKPQTSPNSGLWFLYRAVQVGCAPEAGIWTCRQEDPNPVKGERAKQPQLSACRGQQHLDRKWRENNTKLAQDGQKGKRRTDMRRGKADKNKQRGLMNFMRSFKV